MASSSNEIEGVKIPPFLYGTAWKEDETKRLTQLASEQGFRGIDTANQRRHYHEAAVGEGIAAAIASGLVARSELFLQTKFTFQPGQDHRLPYDPAAPIAIQVQQSFASSLEHLQVETLDSYVLHGPSQSVGLGTVDREAWVAMEAIQASGRARLLGVSNVSLRQLELLWDSARLKPRFVQNRCFAARAWDREIRQFCNAHGIVYQGFSLLTANQQVLAHPELMRIAQHHSRTVAQIVFRFALDVGMLPLTGTTNPEHMRSDLDVLDFQLEPAEVERIERLVAQ